MHSDSTRGAVARATALNLIFSVVYAVLLLEASTQSEGEPGSFWSADSRAAEMQVSSRTSGRFDSGNRDHGESGKADDEHHELSESDAVRALGRAPGHGADAAGEGQED